MSVENRAKQWALEVVNLHHLPVPSYLEPRKRKLLKHAEYIKKSLEATDPLRPFAPVAGELGFLPLIIGGGVVAVAAMTKWAKDAYAISTETSRYNDLIKSGLTPQQAQNVLNQSSFNWKMIAIPASVLIGGLVIYKIASK